MKTILFQDLSECTLEQIRKNYISPGFRNCIFMQDRKTKLGYIYFMGYDKDNKPFNFKYRWQCSMGYALKDKDKDLPTDIFGRSLNYKYFDSVKDRKNYISENHQVFDIVDVKPPEQEFLIELFWDVVDDSTFNQQPLRIHWIDIETEISEGFEYPYTARNRINMLTIYDSATKFFYTWSLQKVPDEYLILDDKHIVYDDFENNESDMLSDYLAWHSRNYPDIIQGWNSVDYDIPYLLRRMENVLGQDKTKAYSPFRSYYFKESGELENPNNPDSVKLKASIAGISHLDELLLYRDKFMVKTQADGGYGLNNIGILESLGTKQEYEGSLKDLYENNWGLFYRYNVQDVKLLADIENKCKLINLARQIAGGGCMNYEAIYTSISYIIGSLYCFAKKHMNGKVVPTYANPDKYRGGSYEGAFVFDVEPGFFKNGIITIDFNSLYPNSIRAANISPETYVGKVIELDGMKYPVEPINLNDELILDDSLFTIETAFKKTTTITAKKLRELVKTKLIFTRNNTMFLKPSIKKGLLNSWCEYNFNKRKEIKKKMAKAHKEGDKVKEEQFNTMQASKKCCLNSLYGTLGTPFSPICNPDLAQTVTRQGKFCNISANKFVSEDFKKMFDIDETYKVTAGGDTDSVVYDTMIDIQIS